jgi:hypothetical protein
MRENSRRRLSAKTHFWDDDVEALVAPPPTRDVVPGWQLINIISSSGIIFLRTNALSRSLSLKKKNFFKVSSTKAPFLVVS